MSSEERTQSATTPLNSGAYPVLAGVEVCAKTDIGKRREENQDNFVLIEKPGYKLFVVADGMGGARGGAVASSMAVLTIKEQFKGVLEISTQKLSHALAVANSRIYDESINNSKLAGMGTTIACLAVTKESLLVAHVGDSRVYRLRDGVMQKLTDDHTLVNELLRTGAITADQAEHHPVSHMLTRSLGTGAEVEIDCRELSEPPRRGDTFILMSDGLYNLVQRQEMFSELTKPQALETSVQSLIDLANERGGTDNITIITARLTEPFPEASSQERLTEIKDTSDEIREPAPAKDSSTSVHVGIHPEQRSWNSGMKGIGAYRVPLFPVIVIFIVAFTWGIQLSLSRERHRTPTVIDISREGIIYPHQQRKKTVAIDEVHSIPVLNSDPERLRKSLLEAELKELNQQHSLLMLRSRAELDGVAKQLNDRSVKNVALKDELVASKERATRKLAAWYSRKQRLETVDPINLAREISGLSDTVKARREAFEEVTWRYFKEAEALRYNPNDEAAKGRITKILAERRAAMDALGQEVRSVIDNSIAEAEHALSSLTERSDLLTQDEKSIDEEKQMLAIIKSGNTDEIAVRIQEVEEKISAVKDQLALMGQKGPEIDDLVSSLRE